MPRTQLVISAALVMVALGACSSTATPAAPAASAAPAKNGSAACAALVSMETAATAYPGGDPSSPPPSADAVKKWAATVTPHFGIVALNVPADLDPATAIVRSTLSAAEQGTPVNTQDAALTSALTRLDRWGHDNCGFTKLDVVNSGTELGGVPATLPAGPIGLSFRNAGPPDRVGFVLLVAKVKDGAQYTIEQVRSGAVDFSTIADVAVAAQPTPAEPTAFGIGTLPPGRYLVVSPIGAPPEFTGVLATEFKVG